jgi:hypothetical protein
MPVTPATQEAEIKRITVQAQPRQKVNETPSQSISCAVVGAPVIPAAQEVQVGGCGLMCPHAKPRDPI